MAAPSSYNSFVPRIGERSEVTISHAEYDKEQQLFILWGQFHLSQVEQIEEALAKLQDLAQQKAHPRGQLRPGELCLGKSIQDNRWHRAVIQTATGNDVLAFYFDYGSTEFVPCSRIRTMDSDLQLDFEGQATKLLLRGIQPIFIRGGIKTGTLDYLDRYVVNRVFVCEPMEHHSGGATSVKLYARNGKRDIAAQFIAEGFAEPATHQPRLSPVPVEEFTELQSMGLDVGQRERVYVSYVTSPTQFWLQQEVVAIDLDDMMSDIQAFFGNPRGPQRVLHAVPNMPCVTRYDDKQFYRCQVVRSTGLQTCEVIFVDYGNVIEVDVSALFRLPDQFSKLPSAAIEAGLSGIDPKSCSSEAASNRFNDLTIDRILCIKVDSADGPKVLVSMVDPRSEMNLSVAEILIKERLASRVAKRRPHGPPSDGLPPAPVPLMTRSSNSHSPSASQTSPRVQQSATFRHPILREGSRYPVTVTEIASSSDFACQLLSSSSKFEKMSAVLQHEYAAKGPRDGQLSDIRIGSICCAQFTDDELWYRAEVSSVLDSSAEVYFVDYGNSDICPLGKLKQLTNSYLEMEVQSFRCMKLEGVEEIQRYSDMMKTQFMELVGEDELEATICQSQNNSYVVELFNKVSKLNVNEEMKKFCASLRPQRASPPKRSVPDEFRKIEPTRGDKIKVYVSNIESPNLFHCQPVSSAEELQRLMDTLNDPGTAASASPLQPTLQAPCMAKYDVDGIWYRAVVTGMKRSGEVEVRFIDFGNHQTVPPSAIKLLQEMFMSFPMQGIPCSLEGLSLKSWTDDEINRFSDMFGDNEVVAEFGNRVGDNYEVKLTTETGISVKEVLQPPAPLAKSRVSPGRENSNTHRTQSPSSVGGADIHQFIERELKVGPNIPVFISHVENLSEIHCQPASATDDLETLMVKLDQAYSKLKAEEKAIKNPRLGIACVAQFQEDKNWYRAIVINKQLKRAYVCFVDYGNFEYVPTSCIKEIDREIMKVPAVAVKCSLRGSKDLEGPLRVKKLRGLIDEVEGFNCKVISSANGVFEVELMFGGGKSVGDVLKSVPKEEAAPVRQQTPPRGQRSEPPMSPSQPAATKAKSPPQVQRSFEPKPQKQELPPPAATSKKKGWGDGPSVAAATPTPRTMPPASTQSPKPVTAQPPAPPAILKQIKHQDESVVISEFLDVFVSFLESPARFWLQQASMSSEIDSLMETLTETVSSGKLPALKEPQNGQLCIAQSITDEAHYRARVLKKVDDSQVEVYYVDYGNREVVPLSSVVAITPELLKLPAQAMQCSLEGVPQAGLFTEAAVERFTELTLDKQLVAKPTKRPVNSIQLELVDTNGDEDVNISAEVKKTLEQSPVASLPTPEIPDSGTAYVTQVAEDGSFFIQLGDSTEALEEIHAEIQKAYAEEMTALGVATPGQLCCSPYSEDGEWYRGMVEEVQESGDANVRFLDYGNASTCKVSELKVLLPQFMERPAIAIKCQLRDLRLTGIPEIGSYLEELTLEKELTCTFHDKEMPCQVSLSENDVNLNDVMKKKFDHQPKVSPKVEAEPGMNWVFQSLEPGKKFEAYISSVVSPGYFFVQPSSVTKELENLMVEMQSCYSQASAELLLSAGEIPTGTLCAALYAEDNLWYRAEIMQMDGDKVTVHFPDYGNSDVVTRGNLKVLLKKHSDLTLKAIGCSLNGVSPSSGTWSLQSGEFFEAETMDKPLLVEVVKIATASTRSAEVIHSVKLLDMGMNVVDKLIKAGHASDGSTAVQEEGTEAAVPAELVVSDAGVFSGYSSYQLNPRIVEGVFITAVTALSDFCIQLSRHANEVEEFCGRLDEFYKSNEVPSKSDVEVGTPCVVQYSEDEVWYRAVVVEITEGTAYVTFVDYGNGDSVPVTSIKELNEEFLGQPSYAFRCSLGGIDQGSSTDNDKVAKFEELMDKETLTAKVLEAKDGILKVQLLDGDASVVASLGLEEDLTAFDIENSAASAKAVVAPETSRALSTTMYPGYNTRTLPAGTVQPVFLTSVAAFSEFCIQLGSDADAVADFTAEFDEHYKGNEVPTLESVDVGMVCAAQFTDDEVWYRSLVVSLDGENADVLFIDYGNSDTLAQASLKVLQEQFLEAPTFALKCSLAGTDETADENEAALEKFQEFLECESLQVRVIECNDEILSVQLLDSGKSITADLGITEALELPSLAKSYKHHAVPPGTSENVYLTSVSSLKDFAIQLQKFEDAVGDFNAKLDEFYKAHSVASLDPVVPGMQCVGKFSDDGVWYRGKVERLEGTSAEVTFVDYGNNDLIECSELKELHPDYAEQQTFSFQCRLAGIAAEGQGEDTVAKFEEFMDSEGLVAMVIGLEDEERLVVQLLEGGESVAVKLGLVEDLASEKASGLSTAAQSLVEEALSSALKDIELEESLSSTEDDTGQSESSPTEDPVEAGEPSTDVPAEEDLGEQIEEDAGSETKADPGSSIDADPGTQTEQEPGSNTKGEPGTQTEQDSGSNIEGEPGTQTEQDPGSNIEVDPGTQTEQDPGSNIEGIPGTRTEQDPGSSIEGDPGTQTEQDPGVIAGALIKEVVESACRELTELSLNNNGDDTYDERTAPSLDKLEPSPPRISVSPPVEGPEEEEFEDAEMSPTRGMTSDVETEGVLHVDEGTEEMPSGEEDESFEDALDQSEDGVPENTGDEDPVTPRNVGGSEEGDVANAGEDGVLENLVPTETEGEEADGGTIEMTSEGTEEGAVATDEQDMPPEKELNGKEAVPKDVNPSAPEVCVENGVPSGEDEETGREAMEDEHSGPCDQGDLGGSGDDSSELPDKEATAGGDADKAVEDEKVLALDVGDVSKVKSEGLTVEPAQENNGSVEDGVEEQTKEG